MTRVAIVNSSPDVYNLAVHRIANYHRGLGDEVAIAQGGLFLPEVWDAEKLYFSTIFTWDLPGLVERVNLFKQRGAQIEIGGPAATALPGYILEKTGIRPATGLDQRFEHMPGEYQMVFTSRGCPRGCEFCHPANTQVLMGDLTWRNIQDVKVGETIVGVEKQGKYKYKPGEVLATMSRQAEVWAIETSEGTVFSTKEHPWLMRDDFKSIEDIQNTSKYGASFNSTRAVLRKLATPIDDIPDSDDYRLGYIIGSIEGDGYLTTKPGSQHIKIVSEYENLDAILRFAEELGLPFYGCNFNGGKIYKNVDRAVKCSKAVIVQGIQEIIAYPPVSSEFKRGWLAGIYDAEGSWTSTVRISNFDPLLLSRIKEYLDYFEFRYTVEKSGVRLIGGRAKCINFMATVKPRVKHLTTAWIGTQINNKTKIIRTYKVGLQDVYNLTTDIHTFIADGFVTHNCIVKEVEGRKMIEYEDYPVPVGENPWIGDNNILATSWEHQVSMVEKLKDVRNLDLNSGFDDRIFAMNPEKYWDLYSRLHLERWRFAYDKPDQKEPLTKCVEFLHSKGVRYSSISVFCLVGWPGTTFEEGKEKLQYLVDIDTSPYPMRYRPLDCLTRNYVPPNWDGEDMNVLFNYYGVPWFWRKYKFDEFKANFKDIAKQQKERLFE
jgi:hypothetical protein